MDDRQDKHVLVFGYGIALLVPFLLLCKISSLPLHPVFVVAALILFLFVLNGLGRPLLNLAFHVLLGLVDVLLMFLGLHALNEGSFSSTIGPWPAALFLVSVLFFVLAKNFPQALVPVFRLWMRLARAIGEVFSRIALAIVFYLIFSPVGILLRILKKDLLDQRMEPDKNSYWTLRKPPEQDKGRYLKQF